MPDPYVVADKKKFRNIYNDKNDNEARRRGLVSRWSSRTREAQWEEEQTADLSGAHCIFPAKTRVTILKRESVLS